MISSMDRNLQHRQSFICDLNDSLWVNGNSYTLVTQCVSQHQCPCFHPELELLSVWSFACFLQKYTTRCEYVYAFEQHAI